MNVMNVMVGSTFVLLVAGLFISYSSMKSSPVESSDALEIARLEKREAQLEAALAKAKAQATTFTPSVAITEAAPATQNLSELEKVRAELQNLKQERDNIEQQAAEVIEDALSNNTPPAPSGSRPNLIKTALVLARVTEYDNVNKVAGLHIQHVGNVNTGDTLGIRRNNGIIGRLTVGMVDQNQAIADPLPGSFLGGSIDIQVGDELILPPDF